MDDVNKLKEKLRDFQKHFNPEKVTYKVLEDVINGNYSTKQMIFSLSKIRGISKYPVEVKNEFMDIAMDLKKLRAKEKKQEEAKKQEENTKELKDIIEKLETSIAKENKKQDKLEIKKDKIEVVKESPTIKRQEKDEKEKEFFVNNILYTRGLKKILLVSIIIVLIIVILVFFIK